MRIPTLPLASLFLALAGCSSADEGKTETPSPDPQPAPVETPKPGATNLSKVACRFTVPASLEGSAYQCYDLAVPENRSKPGSRTIQIHTIVFRGKAGGTPTIELNGGPGGPSEDIAVPLSIGIPELKDSVGRFLELGDYVLVDQRGTGRSIPRIACTDDERYDSPVAGGTRCVERHTKQGIDLTGYVTSENAEDIHDLKVALGATKVNLHSISYGTRLALEILRRHPDDVAGTIIDGVMPAQAKALTEGDINIDRLMTHIFDTCAKDAKCKAAYPDLEQALEQVKTKLTATPFTWQGEPYGWEPFIGDILQQLYADGFAGEVPFRIYDALSKTQAQFEAEMNERMAADDDMMKAQDDALNATELGREALKRIMSDPDPDAAREADGMFQAVVCSDFVQYESIDEALALEAKVRPALQDEQRVHDTWDGCKPWPKRPKSDDVWAPVASQLPVLAVAGAFDPVTPIAWRDLATSTLPNSQKLTMRAGAHGALDACAMGNKLAFYTGAPIDPTCADSQTITFQYEVAGKSPLRPRVKPRSPRIVRAIPISPIARSLQWGPGAKVRPGHASRWLPR